MTQRRMINTAITNSARFIKLPVSSQNLYFHLAINTDDDGVCEAYSILKTLGSNEGDLQPLLDKKFITLLNDDLVTFINDWHSHNVIRSDRKKDSIYKELLIKIVKDIKLIEAKNRSDRVIKNKDLGRPMDGHMSVNGRRKLSKVKLREVNISKNNINTLIDYYNLKKKTNIKGSKVLLKNIETVLTQHNVDECKKVIDYILSDKWYIDNKYDTLSVIFKPTKFFDKLERTNNKSINSIKNCSSNDFSNVENDFFNKKVD